MTGKEMELPVVSFIFEPKLTHVPAIYFQNIAA